SLRTYRRERCGDQLFAVRFPRRTAVLSTGVWQSHLQLSAAVDSVLLARPMGHSAELYSHLRSSLRTGRAIRPVGYRQRQRRSPGVLCLDPVEEPTSRSAWRFRHFLLADLRPDCRRGADFGFCEGDPPDRPGIRAPYWCPGKSVAYFGNHLSDALRA